MKRSRARSKSKRHDAPEQPAKSAVPIFKPYQHVYKPYFCDLHQLNWHISIYAFNADIVLAADLADSKRYVTLRGHDLIVDGGGLTRHSTAIFLLNMDTDLERLVRELCL
jgi:hypothetical protein